MNLDRPIRSNGKIWLAISIPLFIACWFLRGGKGGDEPFGIIWLVFIRGDYICPVTTMLGMLGFYTFIFAAAAGLIGWILHCFLYLILDYFRKDEGTDDSAGNQ